MQRGVHAAQIQHWVGRHTMERYARLFAAYHMVVAERDGAVCGFGIVDITRGRVVAVYVSPAAARGGVGRRLLAVLEDVARAAGIGALALEATLNAEPFYARAGFVSDGPVKVALSETVALDAIRMHKSIA